ncbi:hypothetical protein AZSI13_32280 [Azospira sp. I13]|uniref:hypothetical protein n=1 Tax=Azospira sp. I13 TaxID=1765050 RepID=UPI000D4EF6D8|nr:hypothetical protein [Azospira sp. I13]GBG03901.1 hypothetical protein AZSI13_32280 [Azospira sp. I13]
MMLEVIRQAILDRMNLVPGIGKFHRYERYAKAEKEFRALYAATDGQLRGGYARRRATRETTSDGFPVEQSQWDIRLYMALADGDESELAFDALIESARDAFRADPTLGHVVMDLNGPEGVSGLQLEDSVPVMFCGVLCHCARLALFTNVVRSS